MKHIDIDRAFKTRLIEQIRQRKLKHLTSSLMAMLHINPHGKELVCVCGEGTERDNTAFFKLVVTIDRFKRPFFPLL